jgi:hypothetical protein
MVDVGEIGDVAIVRITDEIDVVSAPRLEHVIKTVELMGSTRILLSLEGCSYCELCNGSGVGSRSWFQQERRRGASSR